MRKTRGIAAGCGALTTVSLVAVLFTSCRKPVNDAAEAEFHGAVAAGDLDPVRELLAESPELANSRRPSDGRVPLHFTEDPEIIELLLSNGADALQPDLRGRSPVRTLLDRGLLFHGRRAATRAALTAFLDGGVRFPVDGVEGDYILHASAVLGHAPLLRYLVENNADTRSLNGSDGTLLHSVSEGGLDEVVATLLADGFDANARDRYGLTPLILAAREGYSGVVGRLLAHGATANAVGTDGRNGADYAADFGHDEVVRVLGERGVHEGQTVATDLSGPYLGMSPPGAELEPFAVGVVSTAYYDHSAPVFSPDGMEVYWSVAYTSRGDFILSMTNRGGNWSVPRMVPFCDVGQSCMYPTISADGAILYFVSDRPASPDAPPGGMNIWLARRELGGWSQPHLVGFAGGDEYGLTVADDGTLYFMADYDGGEGSSDLYLSRPERGEYTPPQNLGPELNSAFYEDEPYIAPDGSFLLFASLRPGPAGRIYSSLRTAAGLWNSPVNITSEFGLGEQVRFPRITSDGRYVFVGANRGGNWDLYWADARIVTDLPAMRQPGRPR